MYLLKVQNGKLSQALFRMAFKEDILQFLVLPSHPSLKDKRCRKGWLLFGSTSGHFNLLETAREGTRSHREPISPGSCSAANVTLPLVFFSRSLTVKQGEKAEVSPAALRTEQRQEGKATFHQSSAPASAAYTFAKNKQEEGWK